MAAAPPQMEMSTVMHVPAGAGIDESTREEHVPLGQANLLSENLRAEERGAAEKRLGFVAHTLNRTDGTTRSLGKKVFPIGKSVGVIDGTTLDIFSPQTGKYRNVGRVPELGYSVIESPSFFSSTTEDIAYANGYIATSHYALTDDGGKKGVVVSIVDETSRTQAHPTQILLASTTALRPFVCAISNRYFLCSFADNANITAYFIDTQNLNTGWAEIAGGGGGGVGARIGADFGGLGFMAVEQLTDRVAIAYSNGGGGTTRVTVKTFDLTGILQSTTITTLAFDVAGLDIAGSLTDTLWVSWTENGGGGSQQGKVIGLNPTNIGGAALAATGTIHSTGGTQVSIIPTTTGRGVLYGYRGSTGATECRGFRTNAGSCTTDGAARTYQNFEIAARGFYKNGRQYIQAYCGDQGSGVDCYQQQLILCDVTDTVVFARPVTPHSFYTSTVSFYKQSKTVQGAGETYYTAHNRKKTASSVSAEIGVYNFAPTWETASFQGCTFIASGGALYYTDNDSAYEANFFFRPGMPSESHAAGSAYTTTLGGYRYIAVYEHIDALGNLTISGISDPSVATGNFTTKDVIVTVVPLCITNRRKDTSGVFANPPNVSTVRIGLYRTTDGGKVFYRLATLINDVTAASITFTDNSTADAVLQRAAKLYRQPGIPGAAQDRRAAPPVSHLKLYNGILVGSSGRSICWSGQPIDGEGAWFSPLFTQPVDGEGDEVTALESQDGTLYAFKRDSIYALNGEAQSDNAAQGGFGSPRRLATDVGCTDARSLCLSSVGIWFRSRRGIEVLNRGQAVQWLGEMIQKTLASYPIVTAGVVDTNHSIVRFACVISETSGVASSEGVQLVYDLTLEKWISKDTHKFGTASSLSAQSASFIFLGGAMRYAFLRSDGNLYYEQDATAGTAYLDGGNYVESVWSPAILKLGLLQEQMVAGIQLLAERKSACGLKVEFATNYGAFNASYDKIYTEAEVLAWAPRFEHKPLDHAYAQKMRIRDTAPVVLGTGRGLSFVGLSVDQTANGGLPPIGIGARK